MIVILLGLAFLIIAVYFVYKTAKQNGYNAFLWAFLTIISFFGAYFFLSFLLVIIVTVGAMKFGWSKNIMEGGGFFLDFFILALSIGCVMLILRHVNKIPDEDIIVPPPPKFDQ